MSEPIKMAVANVALSCLEDGMVIGLGSGTTAETFIKALGRKMREEKLRIQAVASSKRSQKIAEEEKIPLLSDEGVVPLDLMFDGADEIDPKKNMIKGLGGALFREKVLASSAKEMVVLVEERKLVPFLGRHGILPVEILPFAFPLTIELLKDEGYIGTIRRNKNSYTITDNGNYLLDISLEKDQVLTIADHDALKKITGVVETGLFFHMAGRIIVGYDEDHIEILS